MPSVREAEVVEYFDDMLSHLELKERLLIRALIALLEVQTLIFNPWRPTVFTKASLEDRTKNLKGWETSSIFQRRIVFMAIRTMLLFAYVDSQETERSMGLVAGTKRTAERMAERKAEAESLLSRAVAETPAEQVTSSKQKNGKAKSPGDDAPPSPRALERAPSLDSSVKDQA